MPYYENDPKSERLKLPASSFWIPSITVLLLVLCIMVSLVLARRPCNPAEATLRSTQPLRFNDVC